MSSGHGFLPLQAEVIYGPILSRRLGPSLGVNLLPPARKVCSFNCVYCQYGPGGTYCLESLGDESMSFPSPSELEAALSAALRVHPDVNYITFSGNGEATLHPRFPEMVDVVTSVRDRLRLKARTAILTNSTGLRYSQVRDALRRIESPFMKLDAGSAELFKRINRPHPQSTFDETVDELLRFDHPNLMIQAIFFSGEPSNIRHDDIKKWAGILGEIRAREVHIYTTDRPVAKTRVQPVDRSVLEAVSRLANRIARVPIRVF